MGRASEGGTPYVHRCRHARRHPLDRADHLRRSSRVGDTMEPSADTTGTGGFLSEQPERRTFESVFARLVATAGIVGVGTALGAILIAADVAGWITGLVVSVVAVALAAMLWRSRRL